MRPNILLIAPPDETVRAWLNAETPADRWRGAMVEQALLEVVRALDGPTALGDVYLPWSPLLAPLVTVALADGRERFDPETGRDRDASRTRFLPYARDRSATERDREWLAALALDGDVLDGRLLGEIILMAQPRLVVALDWPEEMGMLDVLPGRQSIFAFDGLLEPRKRAWAEARGAVFLSAGQMPSDETIGGRLTEELEATLEPFIPYGLLIQRAFARWLGDDFGRHEPFAR